MDKKTYIKNRTLVYSITVVSIFTLIIGCFLLFSSLNIKSTKNVPVLYYNEKSNIDYKVYLKENNYFKEKYLEKNKQYIASIIDYLDIDYDYSFSSSKDIDANFNYKIVGIVKANYKEAQGIEKEVWIKDYVLKQGETKSIKEANSYLIKENIKVNYKEYNDIVNNFKKEHMIPVTATLEVKMLVEVDGKYVELDKDLKSSSNIVLSIPLSEQTVNIKLDYKDINNKQIIKEEKVGRFNNIYYFILGLIISLIGAVVLVILLFKIIEEDKKQSKYIKELKKILHDFADIIVEVNEPAVIPIEKSSEVKNFNELVNAQVEVKAPIMFAETVKNEEGLFVLMGKEYCYYYKLNSDSFEQK